MSVLYEIMAVIYCFSVMGWCVIGILAITADSKIIKLNIRWITVALLLIFTIIYTIVMLVNYLIT